jgi:Fur family transcriptional regulator, zinc uptake regulator
VIDQREARIDKSAARVGNDAMVFDIIRAANGPLPAYDILDRLKPTRPRIAPPTIYRALEHLIADGLVRRIESLNAYLTADERAPGTVVFAICDDCGRVQQRDAGAEIARLTRALAKDGFRPSHPMVEVHGRCGDCHTAGSKA